MPETDVREYQSMDDYQRDLANRAKAGWRVVSTNTVTPRSGCMRMIMLGGIGALLFRPKPRYVVTYARD